MRECALQHGQCRKTPIIIWSLGFLFLVGFSWLPCFYFCCCSKDPKLAGSNSTQPQSAVQVGGWAGGWMGGGCHIVGVLLKKFCCWFERNMTAEA